MRYFKQMTDKWGFNDGSDVPPDANAVRELWVRWLNRLANNHGSRVRAHIWDHPVHNPCRIMFVALGDMTEKKLSEEDLIDGQKTETLQDISEVAPDDVMSAILDITEWNHAADLLNLAWITTNRTRLDMTAIDQYLENHSEEISADIRGKIKNTSS